MDNFAMSGQDHNAIKQQLHKLENQLFVTEAEKEALFNEFVFLLLDLPRPWIIWHIDNFHTHRLPESVMIRLREELNIPLSKAA